MEMGDLSSKDGYRWSSQNCPICEVPPTKFIGRRGGKAHRQNAGAECEVWRCGKCHLTFPNPMPIPLGGTDQHYGSAPDEYFQHHDPSQKERSAATLLKQAEELIGSKGNLLDIG